MKGNKSLRRAGAFFLLTAITVAALLFYQLIRVQRKENQTIYITAEYEKGDVTREQLEKIQQFPGLSHIWTALSVQTSLSVEGYRGTAVLLGVNLETYPVSVLVSAGEKRMGDTPLLLVGEDFLAGLTDEAGGSVTERQKKILRAQMDSLEAELTFEENKETVTAQFLGIVSGSELYMDADQLRTMCERANLYCSCRRICLEISGSQNAEKAKESLTKAGFTIL